MVVLVFCTAADPACAEMILHSVIYEKLAACGSYIPSMVSLYSWKGKLIKQKEVCLLFKTIASKQQLLINHLKKIHPYEVPEILAVPLTAESQYLSWVMQVCSE